MNNPNPIILSLDLGTKTGWALSNKHGRILSGTAYFRPRRFEGGGMRYLRFKRWLNETRNIAGEIEAVYFEEVRRHLGVDAAHAYGGFLASLTAWCEEYRLPYEGVPVGTIKKFITGKGNAGKQAVIHAVKALGQTCEDDSEAENANDPVNHLPAERRCHRAPSLRHPATQHWEVSMSNATRLLQHALTIVEVRGQSYGDATTLFNQIAKRWSLTLGVDVSAEQVVLCMLDLKLARLSNDPNHTDSMVDVAGYAAVLADVTKQSGGAHGR